MDWLEKKEHFLQRLFDNFFRRGENACLQPVEIAKKMAKKMTAQRTISINNVYVPNVYLVYLNPKDFQHLSAFEKPLAKELGDYISKKANDQNFTLVGSAQVELEVDDELAPGEMRIHARMEEGQQGEGAEEVLDEGRDTLVFAPVNVPNNQPVQAAYRLIIISGPDSGRSFFIRPGKQILGRQPACDFVLTDEQVSRRHCQLEESHERILLIDLGSRNGTLVNGKKVERCFLNPGERFQVGRTVLELELG